MAALSQETVIAWGIASSAIDYPMELITPSLGAKIEAVVKYKDYWGSNRFFRWEGEYYINCNLYEAKNYFWTVSKLPAKEMMALVPDMEYINRRYKEGNDFRLHLTKLLEVAAPWNQDDIRIVISETDELLYIWNLAWKVHNAGNDSLLARTALKDIQDRIGTIENITSVPSIPFWRIKRES